MNVHLVDGTFLKCDGIRAERGPIVRSSIILSILDAWTLAQRVSSQSLAQSQRIVIAASAVLDGKGHVLSDTRIVIDGSKIVAIDPKAGPVDYDLPDGVARLD